MKQPAAPSGLFSSHFVKQGEDVACACLATLRGLRRLKAVAGRRAMKADSISLLRTHVQRGANARLPTAHGEFGLEA